MSTEKLSCSSCNVRNKKYVKSDFINESGKLFKTCNDCRDRNKRLYKIRQSKKEKPIPRDSFKHESSIHVMENKLYWQCPNCKYFSTPKYYYKKSGLKLKLCAFCRRGKKTKEQVLEEYKNVKDVNIDEKRIKCNTCHHFRKPKKFMKGDEQLKTCSKCRKKSKKYREKNKDNIKQYYQENKVKEQLRKSEKITCNCGSQVRRGGISGHKKSIKHQKYINSLH